MHESLKKANTWCRRYILQHTVENSRKGFLPSLDISEATFARMTLTAPTRLGSAGSVLARLNPNLNVPLGEKRTDKLHRRYPGIKEL